MKRILLIATLTTALVLPLTAQSNDYGNTYGGYGYDTTGTIDNNSGGWGYGESQDYQGKSTNEGSRDHEDYRLKHDKYEEPSRQYTWEPREYCPGCK